MRQVDRGIQHWEESEIPLDMPTYTEDFYPTDGSYIPSLGVTKRVAARAVLGAATTLALGAGLTAVALENIDPQNAAAAANCTPIAESEIDDMLSYMAAAKARPSNIADDVVYDADAHFAQYGLTYAPTWRVKQMIHDTDPPELYRAVDYASTFTIKNFGFSIESADMGDPAQTESDLQQFMTTLDAQPKEANTVGDVSRVVLNTPNATLQEMTDNSGAVAAYVPATQTVYFADGFTTTWGHESMGHGLERKFSRDNCDEPAVGIHPNFADINPEGFDYSEGYEKGQNAVVDEATVEPYGGDSPAEDFATVAESMVATNVGGNAMAPCVYGTISETVDRKLATVAATMNEQYDGLGDFYAEQVARRVC